MKEVIKNTTKRIALVDALRGFALLGILCIHFIEHFELFKQPEFNYLFSAETNKWLNDAVIFLVSGKAYSIFAVMFGFSFFIQLSRKESAGIDFRRTFAWRLLILFIMGLIHSLIYRGDILNIYAFLGLFLLLFYNLKPNSLLLVAILYAIQLPVLYYLLQSIVNPEYRYIENWGGNFFANSEEVYVGGSLIDVVKVNIWEGRYIVWAWTYYTGRFVQLFALFLVGLYLGKVGFFNKPEKHRKLILNAAFIGVLAIGFFHFMLGSLKSTIFTDSQIQLITVLLKSYNNLAYTTVIVAVFMLIYNKLKNGFIMRSLATYGRMSLTNYVSQALFGVVLFYGFGFGLYKYLGAVWSLLIGLIFFSIQVVISNYWMRNYHYGPLEWLWRMLTYRDLKLKFKKYSTTY